MKAKTPLAAIPALVLSFAALTSCATASDDAKPKSEPTSSADAGASDVAADDQPTEDAGVPLAKSDITAKVKTKSKQCFGSAGCNLDVEVQFGWSATKLDQDYEVTYQISGDQSGPITQTTTFYADGQYDSLVISMSTKSSSVRPGVKVTSVEPA